MPLLFAVHSKAFEVWEWGQFAGARVSSLASEKGRRIPLDIFLLSRMSLRHSDVTVPSAAAGSRVPGLELLVWELSVYPI